MKPRLGFDPEILQPAEHIAKLHMPVLLIAGTADRHATLYEAKLLYARANDPKELWIIGGAGHVDFHRYAPEAYERRVTEFLGARLAERGGGEDAGRASPAGPLSTMPQSLVCCLRRSIAFCHAGAGKCRDDIRINRQSHH